MALISTQALGALAKEAVADGIGIYMANAIVGPVLPQTGNVITEALISGGIAAAGSSASKMVLYGTPAPSLTQFADEAAWNSAFVVGASMAGADSALYSATARAGLSGDVQVGLASGIMNVAGQAIRDQIRMNAGPQARMLTDPVSSLLGASSGASSGLAITFA